MNWPKSLITELAQRRVIVFLGSGASAGCVSQDGAKRPSTWKKFLHDLISMVPQIHDYQPLITELIQKDKFLDAAEILYDLIPKADYAQFMKSELELPRYQPSLLHEFVLHLDPKIVVTTNYDKIYDNYCTKGSASEGYNVSKYYDDHLVSDLRSPTRIIIKAHGCVSDPSKIILTKSQYFRARKEYGNFFKILDAIFLSNTILFLGYSMSDPDIQLILENVNITAPSDHPHYFVTGDGMSETLKRSQKTAYNLDFVEYPAGNFDELNAGLRELNDLVQGARYPMA